MSDTDTLMRWAEFLDALEKNAMYETMYEDSEGRMILVITPLDLYSFVSRLWRERSAAKEVGK
jgi:hypothetical protein